MQSRHTQQASNVSSAVNIIFIPPIARPYRLVKISEGDRLDPGVTTLITAAGPTGEAPPAPLMSAGEVGTEYAVKLHLR
jgi:hypothetical protein